MGAACYRTAPFGVRLASMGEPDGRLLSHRAIVRGGRGTQTTGLPTLRGWGGMGRVLPSQLWGQRDDHRNWLGRWSLDASLLRAAGQMRERCGRSCRRLAAALLATCRESPPVCERYNAGERRGRCGCAAPGTATRQLPDHDTVRRMHQTASPRVSPARRGALAHVGRKPDRASIGEESVTESRYNATSLHAHVLTMRSQCTHGARNVAGCRTDSTDPAAGEGVLASNALLPHHRAARRIHRFLRGSFHNCL